MRHVERVYLVKTKNTVSICLPMRRRSLLESGHGVQLQVASIFLPLAFEFSLKMAKKLVCTEPSRCHRNFVLDFSFLDFFLAFKFLSRLFSRLSFQLFSPLIIYIKGSFMHGNAQTWPRFILGFVTFLFIAENVIPYSLTSLPSYFYNKAMLSQEMSQRVITIWGLISKRSCW